MYKYIESLKRKNNTTEIIFGILLKVSYKKKIQMFWIIYLGQENRKYSIFSERWSSKGETNYKLE